MLDAKIAVRREAFVLDVALAADAGEVIAIVGENGAGKSSLLRALAGLEPLARGRVSFDGAVWDDVEAGVHLETERRGAGVVFQGRALFPTLSALDNVAFPFVARGVPRSEARAKARALVDEAGLGAFADRRAGALSGGEAQAVSLLRALACAPKLLLLDEPFTALDVERRAQAKQRLRAALAGFGGVAVLVTHEIDDALSLAHRVVVMERGRVVQDAPPADLVARPSTPWLAAAVGQNLVRGRVEPREGAPGGAVFVAGPLALAVDTAHLENAARELWAAFPSAAVRLLDATAVAPSRVAATVVRVDLLGGAGHALVDAGGVRLRVNVDAAEVARLVEGSAVVVDVGGVRVAPWA